MHLSMSSPYTPRAGCVGGLVRGFCVFVSRFSPRGEGICNQHAPLLGLSVRMRTYHVLVSSICKMDAEKTVLVRLQTSSGSRNRAVTFRGGKEELLCATKTKFGDVLGQDSELYLQIKDDNWGDDVFLDLEDQEIPQKAVLIAAEIKKVNNGMKELPKLAAHCMHDHCILCV